MTDQDQKTQASSDDVPEFVPAPEITLEEGIPLPEDQQPRTEDVERPEAISLEDGVPLANLKDGLAQELEQKDEPAPKGKSAKAQAQAAEASGGAHG